MANINQEMARRRPQKDRPHRLSGVMWSNLWGQPSWLDKK